MQEFIISKNTKPHYLKETWEFLKSISAKEIKVKKKRILWKTAAIHTYITFSHNFSQHVQSSCLKDQHAKNQIICLTAFFTIAFWKIRVKVSYTKINHVFSCNENASTEPLNYPINLFFSVSKNLVYFWCAIFFHVTHSSLQNMTFWKEDEKKKRKMQKRLFFGKRSKFVALGWFVVCLMLLSPI